MVIRHDKSGDLRPTSAKVREAVFNIIHERIRGAKFLDLFAGSGAVGLEAMSRGALEVTFVESARKRIMQLRKAVQSLGLADKAVIIHEDVLHFLVKAGSEEYDIIFADPPYSYEYLHDVIEVIYNRCILKKGGTLLAEHSSKRTLPKVAGDLTLEKSYRYGDTMLSKFRRTHE